MKFRKVCTNEEDGGSGSWTVASASSNAAGISVKVRSHCRRLPMSTVGIETEERDQKQDANLFVCCEGEAPSNDSEERQTQDHQVAVTPKAKEIQYTVRERKPPSRAVIEYFYNIAMETSQEEGDQSEICAQQELSEARLLSLEDVLLPSIAHQENLALKQIQRKVQRDAPDQTHIVQAGRLAVSECLGASITAVRNSRLERKVREQRLEQVWAQERQLQREEQRKKRREEMELRSAEEADTRKMQSLRDKREFKKQLPQNQALWREAAFLMAELSNLAKEERLWKDADVFLIEREKEVETKECTKEEEKGISEDFVMTNENNEAPAVYEMEPFDQFMQSIIQSANKISSALQIVSSLLVSSGALRKEMYRKYRQDHQFQGYRGVNNPKGLVRILSQDTEV